MVIEAEKFARMDSTKVGYWQTIQALGRANDAVGSYPVITSYSIHYTKLYDTGLMCT